MVVSQCIILPDHDTVISLLALLLKHLNFSLCRNLGVSSSSKPQDDYNFQLSPANGVKPVTPKQQRLFRKYPELVPYIGLGAKFSISQCQYQFKNRRWNCSAHSPENVFGKIVKIGKLALKLFEIFSIDFSCFFSFVLVYPTSSNDKDEFVRN